MGIIAEFIVPEWVGGLITAMFVGAVGWAFIVERRLANMDGKLSQLMDKEIPPPWFLERVKNDEDALKELAKRVTKIERDCLKHGKPAEES